MIVNKFKSNNQIYDIGVNVENISNIEHLSDSTLGQTIQSMIDNSTPTVEGNKIWTISNLNNLPEDVQDGDILAVSTNTLTKLYDTLFNGNDYVDSANAIHVECGIISESDLASDSHGQNLFTIDVLSNPSFEIHTALKPANDFILYISDSSHRSTDFVKYSWDEVTQSNDLWIMKKTFTSNEMEGFTLDHTYTLVPAYDSEYFETNSETISEMEGTRCSVYSEENILEHYSYFGGAVRLLTERDLLNLNNNLNNNLNQNSNTILSYSDIGFIDCGYLTNTKNSLEPICIERRIGELGSSSHIFAGPSIQSLSTNVPSSMSSLEWDSYYLNTLNVPNEITTSKYLCVKSSKVDLHYKVAVYNSPVGYILPSSYTDDGVAIFDFSSRHFAGGHVVFAGLDPEYDEDYGTIEMRCINTLELKFDLVAKCVAINGKRYYHNSEIEIPDSSDPENTLSYKVIISGLSIGLVDYNGKIYYPNDPDSLNDTSDLIEVSSILESHLSLDTAQRFELSSGTQNSYDVPTRIISSNFDFYNWINSNDNDQIVYIAPGTYSLSAYQSSGLISYNKNKTKKLYGAGKDKTTIIGCDLNYIKEIYDLTIKNSFITNSNTVHDIDVKYEDCEYGTFATFANCDNINNINLYWKFGSATNSWVIAYRCNNINNIYGRSFTTSGIDTKILDMEINGKSYIFCECNNINNVDILDSFSHQLIILSCNNIRNTKIKCPCTYGIMVNSHDISLCDIEAENRYHNEDNQKVIVLVASDNIKYSKFSFHNYDYDSETMERTDSIVTNDISAVNISNCEFDVDDPAGKFYFGNFDSLQTLNNLSEFSPVSFDYTSRNIITYFIPKRTTYRTVGKIIKLDTLYELNDTTDEENPERIGWATLIKSGECDKFTIKENVLVYPDVRISPGNFVKKFPISVDISEFIEDNAINYTSLESHLIDVLPPSGQTEIEEVTTEEGYNYLVGNVDAEENNVSINIELYNRPKYVWNEYYIDMLGMKFQPTDTIANFRGNGNVISITGDVSYDSNSKHLSLSFDYDSTGAYIKAQLKNNSNNSNSGDPFYLDYNGYTIDDETDAVTYSFTSHTSKENATKLPLFHRVITYLDNE